MIESLQQSPRQRLAVALATYNGGKWLSEQLESLALQTEVATIIVGDDGSQDDTWTILQRWCNAMPGGMCLLPAAQRHGVVQNFSRILSASDAEWTACCDQDDYWDPEHLAQLLEAGHELAEHTGRDVPILVVADLRLVDANRQLLRQSLWRSMHFEPQRGSDVKTLVVMNMFAGCAMLMNRPLLRAALPIPEQAVMHDWWLALTAAILGDIAIVKGTVGDYRQHDSNVVGAPDLLKRLRRTLGLRSSRRKGVAAQCEALLARHSTQMTAEKRTVLEAAVRLQDANHCQRIGILLRHGITKRPWWRQLNFLLGGG